MCNDNAPPPGETGPDARTAPDVRPALNARTATDAETRDRLVATMKAELGRIHLLCECLMASPHWRTAREELRDVLRLLGRRADTAGYGLLAELAADVRRYLPRTGELTPAQLAVVARYVTAMKFLVAYRIAGHGSPEARRHLDILRAGARLDAA